MKNIYFILFILAELFLFSCSNRLPPQTQEPTVINMYIFATEDSYRNADVVLKEFSRRTAGTLNIDLRINALSRQNYRERMVLIASSGTEVDLVFDAPWMNMNTMVQRNVYREFFTEKTWLTNTVFL